MQLVALGANVSSSGCTLEQTLAAAIHALGQNGFAIRAVSRFFATPCFPKGAGPDYVNAAVALQSKGPAHDILARLHAVEADFGRERLQRWGQRTLDLDLLAMESDVMPDLAVYRHWQQLDPALQAQAAPTELVLPHPRLQDRAFVLAPLNDIAPGWNHPVLGLSVRQMLAALPASERDAVRPL